VAMSTEEKVWRVDNLIVPICRRIPEATGVHVCDSEPDQTSLIFPDQFRLGGPLGYTAAVTKHLSDVTGLSPIYFDSSPWAKKKIADAFPSDLNLISLTLRNSSFFTGRNTDSSVVMPLAQFLASRGWKLLVVPDADDIRVAPTGGVSFVQAASCSLDLRLALYQRCALNLGPSNGPVAMSFLTKNVSMWQYDLLKSDHTGQGVFKGWELTNGFPVGQNYPWAANNSSLRWVDLTTENVIRDVESWLSARNTKL
jgi:hypothetical protein